VAQAIYKGDPSAAANSTEFINYDEGVRMGCWCLLSISLVSAASAVLLEKFLTIRSFNLSIISECFFYF
jgi:solute carrier family 45 protein 1/2/4